MGFRDISGKELKRLIHNYTDNKDLPVHTNWGVALIERLIAFLQEAKDRGDSFVAISLIRHAMDNNETDPRPRMKPAGLGLSQVAFALITGDSNVGEPWEMTAKKNGDKYTVYLICEHDNHVMADPSGLCPPQGDEIKIKD